jgi:hypothetical protein
LGKYHSASTDANADTESFPVCHTITHITAGGICVAISNICISQSEPERCRVGESNAR